MEPVDVKIKIADLTPKPVTDLLCLFCRKKSENKLTLINEKKDILNALTVLGIQYEAFPMLLDYICYQCVYRMNLIIDYRRILQRNIHKSRANYFYNQGNKDMCRKFLNTIKMEKAGTLSSPNNSSINDTENQIIISDVRSEVNDRTDNMGDLLFDCFAEIRSTSTRSTGTQSIQANSPAKLLEPMYETSESVLVTESGGKINLANDYNTVASMKSYDQTFKCLHCPKVYKRESFLAKHMRKHNQRGRQKSAAPNELIDYYCPSCDSKFSTKAQLRGHAKCHKARYACRNCFGEYVNRLDFVWHQAMCFGKTRATENFDDKHTHLTRSQSMSNIPDSMSACTNELPEDATDLLYNERIRDIDNWVNEAPSEYATDDETRSLYSSYSFATSFSRPSSVTSFCETDDASCITDTTGTMRTSIQARSKYKDKDKTTDTKLMSTRASLCSRPKTRSVSAQIKKIDLELEVRCQSRPPGRKNPRSLRKHNKVKQKDPIYHCPECKFTTYTLKDIMKHDTKHHSKLPLFYCVICRTRFTRDEFFQRHSANHTTGPYKCTLCEEEIAYKYEIKHHMELHQIRSHLCNVCQMSFLKENGLEEHMKDRKHTINQNKKKIKVIVKCDYKNEENKSTRSEPIFALYESKLLVQNCMDFEKTNRYEKFSWKLGTIEPMKLAYGTTVIQDEDKNPPQQVEEFIQEIVIVPRDGPLIAMNGNESDGEEEKLRDFQENPKFRTYSESPVDYGTQDEDIEILPENIHLQRENINLEELGLFSVNSLSRTSSLEESEYIKNQKAENDKLSGVNRNADAQHQKKEQKNISMNRHSKRALKHKLIMPNVKYSADTLIPSYETLFSPITFPKRVRTSFYYDWSGPSRMYFN